jgi:hypothetical protein
VSYRGTLWCRILVLLFRVGAILTSLPLTEQGKGGHFPDLITRSIAANQWSRITLWWRTRVLQPSTFLETGAGEQMGGVSGSDLHYTANEFDRGPRTEWTRKMTLSILRVNRIHRWPGESGHPHCVHAAKSLFKVHGYHLLMSLRKVRNVWSINLYSLRIVTSKQCTSSREYSSSYK